MKFAVCVQNKDLDFLSGDDLTVGRLYEVIASDERHGMIRIVDDSGEDFLYPSNCFEEVSIAPEAVARVHEALIAAMAWSMTATSRLQHPE